MNMVVTTNHHYQQTDTQLFTDQISFLLPNHVKSPGIFALVLKFKLIKMASYGRNFQYSRHNGVVVDQDLSLASHVSYVTSVSFFHLRQLHLVRRSLTIEPLTPWFGLLFTAAWTIATAY